MQKIITYIKNGKGVGALWLLLFASLVAFYSAYTTSNILPKAIPYIQQTADEFLPLKIEKGKVVVPSDTLKTRTYQIGDETASLTLDTTKDFLEQEDLREGVTITRSYIYTVNGENVRRQTLQGDFELEKRDYTPLLQKIVDWVVLSIVVIGPFLNFMLFLICVLFYAFCSGLACLLNKTELDFKTKMRFNTVLYIGVYVLTLVLSAFGLNLSFVAFFLLMIALQIILVKKIGTEKIQEKNQ